MKVFYFLNLVILCCTVSFAQTFSGRVLDYISAEPVPYANIGIINKNIGTVSNLEGEFFIELSSSFDSDTLFISCIGYERQSHLISSLRNTDEGNDQIVVKLHPKIYELDEVVIKPLAEEVYTLGFFCDSNSAYGNAFYSEELGTEIGVVIDLPDDKEIAFLQSFRFIAGKFTYDKFPVRLNVYSFKEGLPDKNILMEPIYIELTEAGEYIIDLEKYKIMSNGDFFISLEYYCVADSKEGELVFCAVGEEDEGSSYYRLASHGSWMPERFANTGFSVQIKCEE